MDDYGKHEVLDRCYVFHDSYVNYVLGGISDDDVEVKRAVQAATDALWEAYQAAETVFSSPTAEAYMGQVIDFRSHERLRYGESVGRGSIRFV